MAAVSRARTAWFVAVASVVFAVAPFAVYWFFIGRVPSVSPAEAQTLVRDNTALLVDVREREAFEQSRIKEAVHWPLDDILALKTPAEMPSAMQGKRLLLVCDSGLMSAWGTQRLRGLGVADVYSVADGLCAFTMSGRAVCPFSVVRDLFTGKAAPPVRESPLIEQCALVFTGFGVKPIYMFLSFILAVLLWRSAVPDLKALRWSMAMFFLGEGACATNYLLFNLQSHFWEYLHSLGMVVAFGLLAYAVCEGLDRRLIHFSDTSSPCAARGLCAACQQRSGGPCGLERCFLWLTVALWIVAWMPLTAGLHMVSYNTSIFGTTYNFSHPVIYQIFEGRLCPVAALVPLTVCVVVLAVRKGKGVPAAKLLFAAGVGPLSFSFFRLLVFGVYRDNLVWFNTWEEITEGILIAGVAIVLWIFRSTLFAKEDQEAVSA